jgi:queuosine precursor transporter
MTRRDKVFIILTGIFVTNAVLAELLGTKLFEIFNAKMTVGVLLWPVVFVTTDVVNEYFGKQGVRYLSLLTVFLISFTFVALYAAIQIPASSISPVNDETFQKVFGQSLWIIIGSITAFLFSQFLDVTVFWFLREKTGTKHLWLRSTGSTVISQLIDTFIVIGIAFYLPGKLSLNDYVTISFTNYTYKFLIALLMTPIIYAVHILIDKFLGKDSSDHLIADAAKRSL